MIGGPLGLSVGRFAKNTLSQTATIGLSTLAGAVAAVGTARVAGPRGLGTFSPAWQLALVASLIAVLGTDQLLIRELNRGRGREMIGRILVLGIVLGVVGGAATAAVPAAAGVRAELARAFAVAGVYVALSAPALVLRAALHAKERMELETLAVGAEAVTAVAGMIVAFRVAAGPVAVLVALVAGRLANLGCSAVIVRAVWGPIPLRRASRRWGPTVAAALPLGIAFVMTSMRLRLDIVLVGALVPPADAGAYSAAAVVTFTIPMLATALTRSLYPVLARATGADDPDLRAILAPVWRLFVVGGTACAAALWVLAEPGLRLVYGTGFGASASLLTVMAWLVPIRFASTLCATVGNATGWTPRHVGAMAGVVLATQVFIAAGIMAAGVWGAVWATLAGEVALLAVLVSGLDRRVRPWAGPRRLSA